MMMPARIIQSMLLASAVIAAATIWLAARQPSPMVPLVERGGTVQALTGGRALAPVSLVAGGRAVALAPIDLTPDSDRLRTETALHAFHARQTMLAAMLRAPDARLVVAGTPYPIARWRVPAGRPLIFWAIMLPGMIGLAISAVVLAADPKALPNRLVGLTGVLFQVCTAAPAIVYSRGLAIDGDLFRALILLHEAPATLFGVAMVLLFLIYPRRLVPAAWLWPGAALATAWTGAVTVGRCLAWTHDAGGGGAAGALVRLQWATNGSQGTVTVLFVLLCVALAGQYRATRGDPLARAALLWFGLAVVAGAGSFIALLILPNLAGSSAGIGAETGFPLMLFIYAGLTFGLLRYRLFEAKTWGFRILFAGIATALLWAVDAGMIYGLGLDQGPALGLAVILVGLLYLPARAALAALLLGRRTVRENEMFAAAIEVAFALPAARPARWRALLVRLFDPLEIGVDGDGERQASRIAEDGLALLIPGAPGAPGMRLAYRDRGARLFSAADAALVDELATLGRQAAAALRSYDRGAADERLRMAQDLHDDVGARLLSGIHVAEGPVKLLLQDALRDIRTLVTGLIGENAPLSRVVADIRHETATRLEAAGIELDWPLLAADETTMSYAQGKAITSAIREIVSNAIRHAGADRLTVRIAVVGGTGTIDIADDGCGMTADTVHGNGLGGIVQRIEGIGGAVRIVRGEGGTRLVLSWPIAADPAPAEPIGKLVHAR